MDFLGAVNRVLVNNTIIKGDDDLVLTFSDAQHEATIRFARNSITSELNNLTSFFSIDREKAAGTVVTVAGTRTYTLPTNFVQFWGDKPFFYLSTDANQRLYEYPGGELSLRQTARSYLTTEGFESRWYWDAATVKSVGFYQVPNAIRTWNFDYEKDIGVVNSTDTIPLQTEQESEAFADMASRRFKFLIGQLELSDIEQDAEYVFARSTLMNLMRRRDPSPSYGKRYR